MSDDMVKWYRATLIIIGDELPIDEVEKYLEIEATGILRKGRHYQDNPRRGLIPTNSWYWEPSPDKAVSFVDRLGFMLDTLEPKQAVLQRLKELPGVEVGLFLGFSSENGQGGVSFPAELLLRVGKLGLDIDLDLYPPSEMEGSDLPLAPNPATR